MNTKIKDPSKIIFLSGEINYTVINYSDGTKDVTCFTLLRYQEKLASFVRVSKKYLVNPLFILDYDHKGTFMQISLNTGENMKVSRRRIKDVLLNLC